MHTLLFILYGIACCFLILRGTFFRNSGLRPVILLLLFGIRVTAGCLHNWIAWRFYPDHGDIWLFFRDSIASRQLLLHDFSAFIADNSTLAYVPHNAIEWMHMLFNIFSFDNLYINTLFFSFLAFWGSIALFRSIRQFFPGDLLSALMVLLLPSTLFWTSCIHTEGILYMLLGLFFYSLLKAFTAGTRFTWLFSSLLCLLAMVAFRPAIAFSLLPALGFWVLACRWQATRKTSDASTPGQASLHTYYRMLIALPVLLLLFLVIPRTGSAFLHILTNRQQEFLALTGNSRLSLPALEPSWSGFFRVLPSALFNGFFQPLPGQGGQRIYLAFSAEGILIWLIAGYALLQFGRYRKNRLTPTSSALFTGFLLFSLTGMLLIGFIVPFAGAIIRYRSLFLPFLLLPALQILSSSPRIATLNQWLSRHLF